MSRAASRAGGAGVLACSIAVLTERIGIVRFVGVMCSSLRRFDPAWRLALLAVSLVLLGTGRSVAEPAPAAAEGAPTTEAAPATEAMTSPAPATEVRASCAPEPATSDTTSGATSSICAPAQAPAPLAEPADDEPPLKVPRRSAEAPIATFRSLPPEYDILRRARLDRERGKLLLERDGKPVALTIDPPLQQQLTQLLRDYQTPYAAAVAIEPATGRVLAMAEHSELHPELRGLAVAPIYPAASVFKVVTASALLGEGVSPEVTACYHGGKRRLSARHLEDSPRDHRCLTFAEAMGQSANVVFAKLTARSLGAEGLREMARAYRFNRPLDFAVPAGISLAAIPDDALGLATAGAGFGDVYISPLHGALLAAVPANGGLWRDAVLFEDDAPTGPPEDRVLPEEDARKLAEMMELTVTRGTARRVFRERRFRVPGAVGKTGCLADRNPFRDYSWFVGYAPKDDPKVAVAAVVVNDYLWRIRATWLGREALRLALEGEARWARPLVATVPPPDVAVDPPPGPDPERQPPSGAIPAGAP